MVAAKSAMSPRVTCAALGCGSPTGFFRERPYVVRRREDPLQRVVVALRRAAAVHVVADLALEAVGHMEDHADQVVGRDLHARGADQALLLIRLEGLLEVA